MQNPEIEADKQETTFILVTSKLTDGQINEIKNKVLGCGLEITAEALIELNPKKIQLIWPEIIQQSTKELTFRILSNRPLPLMTISGKAAISKISILKKEMRKLYLKTDDGFNRIMHSPDNESGVERELSVFYTKLST